VRSRCSRSPEGYQKRQPMAGVFSLECGAERLAARLQRASATQGEGLATQRGTRASIIVHCVPVAGDIGDRRARDPVGIAQAGQVRIRRHRPRAGGIQGEIYCLGRGRSGGEVLIRQTGNLGHRLCGIGKVWRSNAVSMELWCNLDPGAQWGWYLRAMFAVDRSSPLPVTVGRDGAHAPGQISLGLVGPGADF